MSNLVGFVVKINEKQGQGKRGPWTLSSMKLADKEGNEIPGWINLGFNGAGCQEGDYVQVEVTESARSPGNYDSHADKVKVAKNPPANPNAGSSKPGNASAKVKESDLFGDIGGYNTEDDIRRMSYTAARDHAIRAVELLIAYDGLKLVKTDSAAGVQSRFDVITGAIDKLTVEDFYLAAGGRKLEAVADSFAEPEADGDLPEDGFSDLEDDADFGGDDEIDFG